MWIIDFGVDMPQKKRHCMKCHLSTCKHVKPERLKTDATTIVINGGFMLNHDQQCVRHCSTLTRYHCNSDSMPNIESLYGYLQATFSRSCN